MKLDMQSVLQQAQKVQEEIERIKAEANIKTVTADSGGGMITVVMNGANEILSIKIAKDVIALGDQEMLEDLIVAAVNKASKAAQAMVGEEMGKVTNMLPNIPGLNLNF